MKSSHSTSFRTMTPSSLFRLLVLTIVLLVGVLILTPFPYYLPPDFERGFLRNKKDFFYNSGYFLGFYAHIAASPIALVCGAIQMVRRVRAAWPRFHQRLGQVYVALMLGLVAPGGAIMSMRAHGGWSSTLCFALISLLAWGFTYAGWRAATSGRITTHGRWMCRSYVMLCSAILLRLVHFTLQPIGLEPVFAYQLSAWLSWVPALVVLELFFLVTRRNGHRMQDASAGTCHWKSKSEN